MEDRNCSKLCPPCTFPIVDIFSWCFEQFLSSMYLSHSWCFLLMFWGGQKQRET
jgi:hypothetical protein